MFDELLLLVVYPENLDWFRDRKDGATRDEKTFHYSFSELRRKCAAFLAAGIKPAIVVFFGIRAKWFFI
jgi:hypothetical protein